MPKPLLLRWAVCLIRWTRRQRPLWPKRRPVPWMWTLSSWQRRCSTLPLRVQRTILSPSRLAPHRYPASPPAEHTVPRWMTEVPSAAPPAQLLRLRRRRPLLHTTSSGASGSEQAAEERRARKQAEGAAELSAGALAQQFRGTVPKAPLTEEQGHDSRPTARRWRSGSRRMLSSAASRA